MAQDGFNAWVKAAALWQDKKLLAWLAGTLAGGPTRQTFDELAKLAFVVFVARSDRAHGGHADLELSEALIAFQELIYSVNAFVAMGAKTAKWQPAIDALHAALQDLVEQGRLDFAAASKTIRPVVIDCMNKLRKSRKMDSKFEDLLNGAL